MVVKSEILKTLPMLSGLTTDENALLLANSRMRNCERGTFLFMHGDTITNFYVVCRGTVQIFRETPDGHEVTSDLLIAGDSLNADEIITKQVTHNKRNDFPNLIEDIPQKTEEEEERNWTVEIRHIKVTSPNWERSDSQRTWRGKYRQNDQDKFAVFHVEDDLFWGLVEKSKIISTGVDALKVQWAFVEENGRRKFTHVLRILEYNGNTISIPMNDKELAEKLHGFSKIDLAQKDLFD